MVSFDMYEVCLDVYDVGLEIQKLFFVCII